MEMKLACRTRKSLYHWFPLILLAFSLIYFPAKSWAQTPTPAAAWPMFHHDPAHTGLSPFSTASNTGSLKWTYAVGGSAPGAGSPIVGIGGTIYITGDSLYAITPNGTTQWIYPITGGDPDFNYSTTTPAQGPDGTIYFGAYNGYFYAINSSGTVRWTLLLNGLNSVFDSDATVDSNAIYVGSDSGNLYALNFDSTTKWTFNLGVDPYANPAVEKGILYMPTVGAFGEPTPGFYKLRSGTGRLMREFQLLHMAIFRFAPAIYTDGSVYQVDGRGNLLKFTPQGFTWSVPIAPTNGRYPDFWSSPAIGADGTVYIGSMDNNLYSISPTGSINWTFPAGGEVYSSPAISADGTIYVGSGENLLAINSDGSLKWSFTADNTVFSSPAIGADGTVYFVSANGTLYAID